jgi:hypothetical protein
VAIAATVAMTLLAGCDDGGEKKAAPAPRTPAGSSPATTVPAWKYTADRLKSALIKPPARASDIKTASGPFNEVLDKFAGGSREEVKQEEPACGSQADIKNAPGSNAPSAFVDFAEVEISSSVLLIASAGEATPTFGPAPKECRTTKSHIGGTTVTSKVIYDKPIDIGDGGWVTGTDQLTGGDRVRSWQVDFIGPGYVATTTVIGFHVTRADAERLARQVFRKASATLE